MNVTDATKFPCGCRMSNIDGVLVMEPCSPTCEVYAYTHTQARKLGRPITEIDLRKSGVVVGYEPQCSECGQKLDGYTGARGAEPKPGDVSICGYCGNIAIYTGTGVRPPTPIEQTELNADDTVSVIANAIRRRGRQ